MKKFAWIPLLALVFASCTKSETAERYLIFKFKFSDTIPRLNNFGNPIGDSIGSGNAALTPMFNSISAHFIELSTSDSTPLGQGTRLYLGAISSDSGIDYSKSIITKDGETFLQVPLSSIPPGNYKWLRVSLAYQNYDVSFKIDDVIGGVSFYSVYNGTVASFIGYKTHFDKNGYVIKNLRVTDGIQDSSKMQGYWGFETSVGSGGYTFPTQKYTGQSQITTVVNPLFATSPVPQGSCVVTARFNELKSNKHGYIGHDSTVVSNLIITGTETESKIIECNLSTRKSFEWKDTNHDGFWEPLPPYREPVIDMGIRGMKPVIK